MDALPARFERANALLDQFNREGLHTGGQVYVSQSGQTLADAGFGNSNGVAITPNTAIPWFSAGKPLTAVAIGQLVEAGLCHWDDRIATHLPEFGAQGKEPITLRDILTHTAGFRTADRLPLAPSWDQMLQQIYDAPLEKEWEIGERAGYQMASSWFVLGALLERLTGQAFEGAIAKAILAPAQMGQSSFTARQEVAYAPVLKAEGGELVDALATCDYPRPGSSARGPIRELGRFYECLLGWPGSAALLNPQTVSEMTRRQRHGSYDFTFLHKLDFGFGLLINSNEYGPETVPYGYGRHASPETYGHSGAQCSCGFADPTNELVVAWVFNLQPGERLHQKRPREFNSAIYEDLNLA